MKYKIQITYEERSSLNPPEVQIRELDYSWNNLDIAKENLQRIKEHNEWVLSYGKWGDKLPTPQFIKDNKRNEDIYKRYDSINYKYESSIDLLTDNMEIIRIYVFWIGYFESLISGEIISDVSDMKFLV